MWARRWQTFESKRTRNRTKYQMHKKEPRAETDYRDTPWACVRCACVQTHQGHFYFDPKQTRTASTNKAHADATSETKPQSPTHTRTRGHPGLSDRPRASEFLHLAPGAAPRPRRAAEFKGSAPATRRSHRAQKRHQKSTLPDRSHAAESPRRARSRRPRMPSLP